MLEIIILLLAGIGAGIVTGFFGGSATLVAVPLLVIFLGYPTYLAIGMGLAIDLFSSVTAYRVYYKNKRSDFKSAIPLIFSALLGVILGSVFSVNIPEKEFSMLIGFGICLVSLKFFKKKKDKGNKKRKPIKNGLLISLIWGLVVGMILGVFGGGGGVVLLIALTMFLGYPTHKAIGTSIFGMILIALFGALTHYINMPFSLTALLIAGFGAIIGALYSAKIANFLSEEKLNWIVGISLTAMGLALFLKGFLFF